MLCGTGPLLKVARFRMSRPVVVIGFLLLLPSLAGILLCIGTLLGSWTMAASGTTTNFSTYRSELRAVGISDDQIDRWSRSGEPKAEELDRLPDRQRAAVVATSMKVAASRMADSARKTGALVPTAVLPLLAIGSFVSGLLGWLLIMRHNVLRCSSCDAVYPAL